jgi:hypothetical protein
LWEPDRVSRSTVRAGGAHFSVQKQLDDAHHDISTRPVGLKARHAVVPETKTKIN